MAANYVVQWMPISQAIFEKCRGEDLLTKLVVGHLSAGHDSIPWSHVLLYNERGAWELVELNENYTKAYLLVICSPTKAKECLLWPEVSAALDKFRRRLGVMFNPDSVEIDGRFLWAAKQKALLMRANVNHGLSVLALA